jgi:IMP dehydrogenase
MRFLNDLKPSFDLTYSDAFLVPSFSDMDSRFEASVIPPEGIGTTIPIVVSNMNAVAGKRMSETVARRGGLVVLPQDIPFDVLAQMIKFIKSRHLVYDTPLTLGPENTIAEALNIIHKRSHGSVTIVDGKSVPIGIFQEVDAEGHDRFTALGNVMSEELVTIPDGTNPRRIFELLNKKHVTVAPVVKNGKITGIISQKGTLRADIYKSAVDRRNRLMVAVAVGINGDVAAKVEKVAAMGADIIVLDTAHGHQDKMVKAIAAARQAAPKIKLVAGNVVTAAATKQLIEAGANIVKVGVGPGAMCTTRMMTAVGRPQLSAVMECAAVARELGGHVWADGGVRYPRDVALALAAGASSVMWGSMWAGTYESVGDTLRDNDGRLYKENYGMASKRAVKGRGSGASLFEQTRRELFEEGISSSKLYIDKERPSAEDIIDYVVAGVRSAMAYTGARTIDEFYEKAVIGIQSTSGFAEGQAVSTSW